MGEAVTSEIAVPPEDFAAALAVVWFNVRMSQKVGLEVATLVKGSATCWTLVG